MRRMDVIVQEKAQAIWPGVQVLAQEVAITGFEKDKERS